MDVFDDVFDDAELRGLIDDGEGSVEYWIGCIVGGVGVIVFVGVGWGIWLGRDGWTGRKDRRKSVQFGSMPAEYFGTDGMEGTECDTIEDGGRSTV